MIYPYTKIKYDEARQFYNILYSFGYTPGFILINFLCYYIGCDIFIVINDTNIFGSFCFYIEGRIDPNIKRTFIEDPYKFLKEAAKYKNITEY